MPTADLIRGKTVFAGYLDSILSLATLSLAMLELSLTRNVRHVPYDTKFWREKFLANLAN